MTTKIDKKIVKASVVKDDEPKVEPVVEKVKVKKEVLQPDQKWLKRPKELDGCTYTVHDRGRDVRLYLTINNREGKPYEVFLNSSHTDSHEWVIALTRLITAMLKNGISCHFIGDNLAKVWGNKGYWESGKFYNSVVSHIADILISHAGKPEDVPVSEPTVEPIESLVIPDIEWNTGVQCPECMQPSLATEGGCTKCLHPECGYLGDCG